MNTRQLFLSHIAQTSENPLMLEIIRASGVWMYGPNDEKYLDLISGISVSNLGHCHPEVVAAVQEQAASFMHLMVYGEYITQPTVRLAKLLSAVLPKKLDCVYFTNSGTEAVEGALKLAKRKTQRTEIISCYNAYHGSTAGALSIMGSEFFKSNYRPLIPGNKNIFFNDFGAINQISKNTAAVIIEPVQAEAGVILPSAGYLKAVRQKCDDTNTLLIFDEIQTGMGRTGKLFAFEHENIIPDILLLAKSFGGGMPIGAFISDQKTMDVLTNNPFLGHITTFGGNAVCAAAAEANLKVLLESNLIKECEAKGEIFDSYFKNKNQNYSFTRIGLMMSIQFLNFETNKNIIDYCITKGVITDWFLFNSAALRICPPLIIKKDDIQFACEIIHEAIQKFARNT